MTTKNSSDLFFFDQTQQVPVTLWTNLCQNSIYTHTFFLAVALSTILFFFLLYCVDGAELPRERGWFIDTTQCRTPVVTFGSSLPHLDQFYYCTLSESFWPHGLLSYTHTHTCIYARSDPGCWRNCMWETLCSEVLFILSCSGWRLQIFSLGIFLIIWHCTPLIWSHMSSTFQPLLWQKKKKNTGWTVVDIDNTSELYFPLMSWFFFFSFCFFSPSCESIQCERPDVCNMHTVSLPAQPRPTVSLSVSSHMSLRAQWTSVVTLG